MSRTAACDKADRAKMDVYVTSRNRAQPCVEWSKQTGRRTPIVGVTKPGSMLTINAVDPEPHPVSRRVQGMNFGLQTSREQAQGTRESAAMLVGYANCDALSGFNRSTVCSIDMLRSHGRDGRSPSPLNTPPTSPKVDAAKGVDASGEPLPPHRSPGALPGLARRGGGDDDDDVMGVSGDQRKKQVQAADMEGVGSPAQDAPGKGKSPHKGSPKDDKDDESPRRRRKRMYEKSAYEDSWASTRPHSRSVNMTRMVGRAGLVDAPQGRGKSVPRSPQGTPTINSPTLLTPGAMSTSRLHASPGSLSDSFSTSKYRRAVGGDFSKSQGRNVKVKRAAPDYDVKWGSVDKAPKAASFISTSRDNEKLDATQWLAHDPVAPLCTRWRGVSVQSWYDNAYNTVKSSPPAVAAPRATTGTTSSVIKSATAQLNMIRSSLLRHTREGERKKKERLAKYALDPRIADRELSPMFSQAYHTQGGGGGGVGGGSEA